jgi:hypothetical protein
MGMKHFPPYYFDFIDQPGGRQLPDQRRTAGEERGADALKNTRRLQLPTV